MFAAGVGRNPIAPHDLLPRLVERRKKLIHVSVYGKPAQWDCARYYLRTPEAAKQFATQGVDAAYSSADELAALMKSNLSQWGKVICDNHLQGE